MSYARCDCTNGDVPHAGAAVHKRVHSRCTRAATVKLRRVVTTDGKRIPAAERMWYGYCALCAAAIQAYQGSEVERKAD